MNEVTEEGYKIEVLKARIASIVSEYEDKIASYEVALQRERQQKQMLEGQMKANVEEPGDDQA